MDFTYSKYRYLLQTLKSSGYSFLTYENFCSSEFLPEKFVILRHDVDAKPENALMMASLEGRLGIKASYYFRFIPKTNQPDKIMSIAALGHEIGYQYEELSILKGDENKALLYFEEHLNYFRQFYPVRTICMHGSPLSKFDNRDLWKIYNYRDFGIVGEPYFDVDFNDVFYLTDTGRCWDGEKFSVRDKVKSAFSQSYHTTSDIIVAAKAGTLPSRMMITTHPQRWTDNIFEWSAEFVAQNLKNIVKRIIIRR
ncbi:MAG: hypothetical protein PHH37_08800 [Paludibacter sp.]|nr:hypothetical protein [Paludibacter sp.]